MSQAGPCDNEAVQTIERPVLSTQISGPKFSYRFSYIQRDDPNSPVLIFIPGGPGQTSMDMGLSLPNHFSVVRTDPRGVGCNKSSLPDHALTSEELAQDILAIIKSIQPRRYILHGISYGTVVATMAPSMIEKAGLPQPTAVVLEGVMGKVYEPNEYLNGYLQKWKELKKTLPQEITRQFLGPQFPLKYSAKQWAAWITAMSIYGETLQGTNLLHENLMLLSPSVDEDSRSVLDAQMARSKTLPSAEKTRLYLQIICRELVPDIRDVKYDFDFQNGDIVAIKDRLCKGIPLSRPYDSAKYQITAPIYYFVGDQDPATPLSQALYHIEKQQGSKFITRVSTGGHQVLSFNLMDCANELWQAIDEGSEDRFKLALQQCSLKKRITYSADSSR